MGRPRKGGGNEDRRIKLDDQQVAAWFLAGMTGAEMAARVGCSVPPIQAALKRLGLKRPAKPRAGVLAGDRNPAWSGGRRPRSDGYIEVWTPTGVRLEHQVVMEQAIGRPLRPGEVVHHIDENKANNTPNNLKLTTQAEHIREHLPAMHAARYGR